MNWRDLAIRCKVYLSTVYGLGLLATVICFVASFKYDFIWLLLALASFFVASINLRVQHNPSVVISMGDVFTLVVLLHFGQGPALITYWANVTAAALISYAKAYGLNFFRHIKYHRILFNLSCCSLSVL